LSQLLAFNVFAAGSYNSLDGYVYSINFTSGGRMLNEKEFTFRSDLVQPSDLDPALAQATGEKHCGGKFTLLSIKKANIKKSTLYPKAPSTGLVVSGVCTKPNAKIPELPITIQPIKETPSNPVITLPVEKPVIGIPEQPITTLPIKEIPKTTPPVAAPPYHTLPVLEQPYRTLEQK
jgi:hypothetical protein